MSMRERMFLIALAMMVAMYPVSPLLAAQAPSRAERALRKAARDLEKRGYRLVRHQTVPLGGAASKNIQLGTGLDGGVYGQWWWWDEGDGNEATWVNMVYLYGPNGDWGVFQHAIDMTNPNDPQIRWQYNVDYEPPPERRIQFVPRAHGPTVTLAQHTCNPPNCTPSGQTAVKVNRFPFWKGYYQCAAMGCGIAALLNFLPGIGPGAFFSACTANLVRCAFGRLWSYDDTPPRT